MQINMHGVFNKRIGVISLGCDKNRVDTEKMLAILSQTRTLQYLGQPK